LDNFKRLTQASIERGAKVFLTGTEAEGELFREKLLYEHKNLVDLSGKMSLDELISFISKADVLVAASTGPLHIAAATGIKAIGIFPPIRPMHPGRWAPIGENTKVFVIDKPNCKDCKDGGVCTCMESIDAKEVEEEIFAF
jgi:ADP-heptose:LPS heptosyltransferase